MKESVYGAVMQHIGSALAGLTDIVSDDASRDNLLAKLGYEVPSTGDLEALFKDVGNAASNIATTLPLLFEAYDNEDSEILKHIVTLTEDIAATVSALSELSSTAPAALVGQDNAELLGRRLLDYMLLRYLQVNVPVVASILEVSGLATVRFVQQSEKQKAFYLYEIHWERLELLWTDPESLLEQAYGWGTDSFNGDEFLTRIGALFWHLGATSRLEAGVDLEKRLETPVWRGTFEPGDLDAIASFELGLHLKTFPDGVDPYNTGLILSPYFFGELSSGLELAPGWQVELSAAGELTGAIGAVVQPQTGMRVVTNDSGAPVDTETEVELSLDRVPESDSDRIVLLGNHGATRWEASKIRVGLGFAASTDAEPDFWVLVDLQDSALVLQASDGDSFLNRILPSDPMRIAFELRVRYSFLQGLKFEGGAGLSYTFNLNQELGPLFIDLLRIEASLRGAEICFQAAATGGIELGPFAVVIKRIGIKVSIDTSTPGNLGQANLSIGFLPPTGIGISLDAVGIVGGGFIDFYEKDERYSGVLSLVCGDIGLVAIGLITTRMPDGSDGFSMLVSITATFNPPIELSYGFTLSGVGGLIGVNRSMSTEELRKGIKTGAINSIMFPEPSTVIANAAKIISDMRSAFPVAEGQYVIGPMLKIGWGSPINIMVVDLGIFIEIGISGSEFEVARVVLMGQAEMALPTPEQKTIGVNIDILGILDLERKEASFQAAIEASSLMAYKMCGDCACLVSWGDRPDMALAIGGFHPKFTPPQPPSIFADLRRMSLVVNYGPLLELGCTGYLAVTPNSLQFGAQVHVFIGISKLDVGIKGYLGFDALFIFSPFSFEFSVCAGMTITAMDITLTEIPVQFTLSGPKPWNAYGKAVFKILFWDVDANFNETWGESRPTTRPLIDPCPEFKDALAAPGGWGTSLPPRWTMVESFASLEENVDSTLVVHPVSTLELRQNVLPLNINLEKFGNALITGHDRFEITAVTSGGSADLHSEFLKEYFARAQFENLGDKALSIPSFEKMDAGITTSSSTAVRLGAGDTVDFEESIADYDSSILLKDGTSEPALKRGSSDWIAARVLTEEYARTRAHRRKGTGNRFLDAIRDQFAAVRGPSSFQPLTPTTGSGRAPSPAAVNVSQDGYRVVNALDLTTATLDPSVGSMYLFSWDEIPGNDNGKLIEFLKQKFEIDWVKTAEIEKIDNGNTIKVSTEINHLSLNLNQEKTEVIFKIDDGRTDKFMAKMENGKLKIYGSINRGLTKVGADQVRLAQLALDPSRDLIVVAEHEITDYGDIT